MLYAGTYVSYEGAKIQQPPPMTNIKWGSQLSLYFAGGDLVFSRGVLVALEKTILNLSILHICPSAFSPSQFSMVTFKISLVDMQLVWKLDSQRAFVSLSLWRHLVSQEFVETTPAEAAEEVMDHKALAGQLSQSRTRYCTDWRT